MRGFRPALVFALIFPLIFMAGACGGGGNGCDERMAGVLARFIALGQPSDVNVEHFACRLPDDMPVELPLYPGADILASVRASSAEGTTYFALLDTSDTPEKVLRHYEEALEKDPWQIQATSTTEELTAIQFGKIDDANIGGGVAVNQTTGTDNRSNILVSLQTLATATEEAQPFELGASQPLPAAFPGEVPIYPGATVTGAGYLRSPGSQDFLLTLVTSDSKDDIIAYYRQQFEAKGWSVEDGTPEGTAVSITFKDSPEPRISGTITADAFARDASYSQADMELRVGSGAGFENETPETPGPEP